ncbi:Flagellar biosynthesis protein FliQ [hydrothermal vent metagenome]|uniref:Flagellar biosynthetic protein FliQ n=1 Tax=hydrothermal vent metagenome TaxID=652676 RepID=A0A3B1BJU3_9ZZZZ
MNADTVIDIGQQAMEVIVLLAAPVLLSALAVGLVIAMFQAATQINEMTLSFVPKLMIVALVLMMTGPWMLRVITGFTERLVESIPSLIG